MRNALEGLLKPEEQETVLGEAEVLAALQGQQGRHHRRAARCGAASSSAPRKARVIRDGVTVYTGSLSSLKRFKDDVRKCARASSAASAIENFNDLKVGDRIESYRMEEVKRTLSASAAGSAGAGAGAAS